MNYLSQLTERNVVAETFSDMALHDGLRPRLVNKLLKTWPNDAKQLDLRQYADRPHFVDILSDVYARVQPDPSKLAD